MVDAAREHGIRFHALLEWLRPELPLVPQAEALRARLAVGESEFAALWEQALAVVQAPELRRFFDPALHLAAYNELSYIGGDGNLCRIDRLVEFPGEVWILDYKTSEKPAPDFAALSQIYRPQLERYRAAMEDAFPAKTVRCALVFAGPTMVEV